jgi:exonuclease VII small subunit
MGLFYENRLLDFCVWDSVKTYHEHILDEEPTSSDYVPMEIDNTILQSAISHVGHERSHVATELRCFEEFQEPVRLATTESTTNETPSETTGQLLEEYKNIVMDGIDYENIYGASVTESLEKELSPHVAEILVSKKPLTRRRKRLLLRGTAIAIERREEFLKELDYEIAALKSFHEELAELSSSVERLPKCSSQQHSLEELIDLWDRYDEILDRCERLLNRRQEQIEDKESGRSLIDQHALNEYLYSDLPVSYPVLSVLADALTRINSKRQQVKPSSM